MEWLGSWPQWRKGGLWEAAAIKGSASDLTSTSSSSTYSHCRSGLTWAIRPPVSKGRRILILGASGPSVGGGGLRVGR